MTCARQLIVPNYNIRGENGRKWPKTIVPIETLGVKMVGNNQKIVL
jgi:hypothetical protein